MSTQNSSFLHGNLARLLFALLAILLAVFAWFQYQKITDLKMSQSAIATASEVAAMGNSSAVSKCVEDRNAQIDQRVADGFLDASLVENAKQQVKSLCIVTAR